jgi:ribosome-binding ATPase YchF (GTP1/OBG family)
MSRQVDIYKRRTQRMRGLIHRILSVAIVLCVLDVMTPWVTMAQDDLRAASEVIKNQKKHYIEKMMELTPQENQAFWALYAEYESGLSKLRENRIELATNFLQSQGNLSDAEALNMLMEKLRIDGDELKFKQSYVAKFRQVLPGRKVVRFYQAENRFDTAASSELYRNIPVIR